MDYEVGLVISRPISHTIVLICWLLEGTSNSKVESVNTTD